MIVKDRSSYLSISYDYGLMESYIYFRVTIAINLYVKKFEVYKVMEFIFTRKNLHLLEDYICYNLQLCLL